MSAIFYAADLGIDIKDAERITDFMELATKDPFVINPKPWAKGGKVRVYFEPWSQNSLRVFHLTDKWFYDCHEDDVFTSGFAYGTMHSYRLSDLVRYQTGNFSGAKTKRVLCEFARVFYEQKTARN